MHTILRQVGSVHATTVHALPQIYSRHNNCCSQGNPELNGKKADAHIDLAVRTLVAHFGGNPNSSLSTKVCKKLLAKKRGAAHVAPHDCFEESDVEDLSVTHRNAGTAHSSNFDKKVAVATVVGGS